MPFDFSRMSGSGYHLSDDPRALFESIPNRRALSLRSSQTEVLKKWYLRRADRDVAIQMNTGSGKTLVGLLICYSSQIELGRPSLYLCPTRQLVEQVLSEAYCNGIPVTDNPDDIAFRMGNSILVTTVHKLFNGKTIFNRLGGNGLRIGRIVVDDAQTSVGYIRRQYTVRIRSDTELYRNLLTLFDDDLKRQDPEMRERLLQGNGYCQYCSVSPKGVWEKREHLMTLLQRDHQLDGVEFSLPLIAKYLSFSSVVFSTSAVEISLPCPDVDIIDAWSKAIGHIFLGATYSSMNDLVIDMNVCETILPLISPDSASDCGDRMILSMNSLGQNLGDDRLFDLAKKISVDTTSHTSIYNTVIVVPSRKRADEWVRATGGKLAMGDEVDQALAEICNGDYRGILILVNRYDGIDLPDGACRVLILDGIADYPEGMECRRARALYDTPLHYERVAHKLEQGMGRGIRGEADYCVVLLNGDELQMATHDRSRTRLFSSVLQKQLELGHQVEDIIRRGDDDVLKGVVEASLTFLSRDEQWNTMRLLALSGTKYPEDWAVDEIARARRAAFESAKAGDYVRSVSVLRKGIDTVNNDEERGWYLEELARYAQQYDGEISQKILARAHKLNSVASKPHYGIRVPESISQVQANRIFDLLNAASPKNLYEFLMGDSASYKWGMRGNSELDERIVKHIGSVLGFDSSRPEKERGDGGPDNLWLLPGIGYSIEVKSDIERKNPIVIKSEMGQTLSSYQWAKEQHPDIDIVPVMIHPSNAIADDTTPPKELRIVTPETLASLLSSLDRFAKALIANRHGNYPDDIRKALIDNHLTAKEIIDKYSVLPSRHKDRVS